MRRAEDSRAVEEEEEEGLEEVVDKSFVIIVAEQDILHATVKTQHIHLVSIANSLIMW